MFDQIKGLYNLKKQAEALQKQMSAEQITGSSRNGNIHLTLNGNHELLKVDVAENIAPNEVAKSIKEAYDDASDKLKQMMAEKFKGMM